MPMTSMIYQLDKFSDRSFDQFFHDYKFMLDYARKCFLKELFTKHIKLTKPINERVLTYPT